MALLAIKVSKKVTIACTVEESTAVQIDRYAAFSQAPADDVVNSALEYVFSKDKDFLEYLAKNPDLSTPETLRVRNPTELALSAKRGPKPKAE